MKDNIGKWIFAVGFTLIVAFCVYYIARGSAELKELRRTSKAEIATLKKDREESKKKSEIADQEARKLLEKIQASEGRIKEVMSERDKYRTERDAARKQVMAMSLVQVRDRTMVVIKTTEIEIRSDGLLFSEMASKINLSVLEEGITVQGLLEKEQRLSFEWKDRAETAEKIIVKKDFIIDEKDIQLRAGVRVEEELQRQLMIERALKESVRLKAFLYGAGGGAALTALLILLVGGK